MFIIVVSENEHSSDAWVIYFYENAGVGNGDSINWDLCVALTVINGIV